MFRQNSKFYSLVLIAADALFLLAAFVAAYVVRVQYDSRPLLNDVYAADYMQAIALIVPFWIIVFAALGLYQPSTYNRRMVEWSKIAIGSLIGILIVIGWQYVSEQDIIPARLVVVYALVGAFCLTVLEREALRFIRSRMFRFGRGVRRVLLIGSSSTTGDIAKSLANTAKSGYKVVAIACPKAAAPSKLKSLHYSTPETALKDLKVNRITTIIQTDMYESPERNQKILATAQSQHIEYSFIPGEAEFYSGKNSVDIFLGYPMIAVYQTPLVGWGAIFKRFFDLVAITITLPLWGTVFIILSLLQKILNPGPVLFNNIRLGKYGTRFTAYKFRSMKPEWCVQDNKAIEMFKKMGRPDLAEEYEKNHKVIDDPRITAFGKFLRATSLDELPQIINVLKGDMSLVGPRPILPFEKRFYKNHGSLLFSVKPGITGLWQVSGRSEMPFEQRVDLELYYAQNWSFWLDLKILFKTGAVVLFGKGAR